MIVGIGFDLIDINELQSDIDSKREQSLERIFTASERAYCSAEPDPYRSFAGTLAVKEATMKAFGTGWTDESDWQDIEVIRNVGKPSLLLKGTLLGLSIQMKIARSFVSISHTKDYAAAVVILEG